MTAQTTLRVVVPVLVGVVAFAAIVPTLLPGVDFWDTGELQTVGPVFGTAHPTGYPTYVILAWIANTILAPAGEPAFRMNLLSALFVAAAAVVTVDLVRVLTRSLALGAMAGLGLALTDIAWSIGTHAEAHALHLLFVALLLRFLVAWGDASPGDARDRRLVAAAIVFGGSMGNHSLTLLLALPIALYVLAVEPGILRRPRFIAICAIALFGSATLVFLQLPLRAGPLRAPLVYGRPETWEGFWYIVLAQQFQGSLVAPFGDLGGKAIALADRAIDSFGAVAVLIPAGFVASAIVRPHYALLSGTTVAITCFFAASYENADIGRYYLGPVLIAWTWLAILVGTIATSLTAGIGPDAEGSPASPSAARAGLGLRGVVAVVLATLLLVPTALDVGVRAARVDRSGDQRAAAWLDETLEVLEEDAVVVSWWSYSTPLWYAQHVEGRRPDIAIIDDRTRLDEHLGDIYDVIDANLGSRPVYVIRADPREAAGLEARYLLTPVVAGLPGPLQRVDGRREPGT